ncbi:hypothetical protein [Kutzneria sp. 744]|uniref:hypothetical protein n=1 Tax=Kutzneria sp. (strain 744) TaxID=345341 RepID=UPI0004BAF9EA|nr:hypothetical protein [Kutzneria sp. 744]
MPHRHLGVQRRAGVILAQLTVSLGPAAVPSQDAFCLLLGLGSATALGALAIAAFVPGVPGSTRRPDRAGHAARPDISAGSGRSAARTRTPSKSAF